MSIGKGHYDNTGWKHTANRCDDSTGKTCDLDTNKCC